MFLNPSSDRGRFLDQTSTKKVAVPVSPDFSGKADFSRTITKRDICDVLYWSLGHISRKDVAALFDQVLDEIVTELAKGVDVKLHEFGKFKVRRKNQRIGRNPRSGVEAVISERRVVSFIASPKMRDMVCAARMVSASKTPPKSGPSSFNFETASFDG